MLNFVHIPKTAGTSFRLAAEQVFGKHRIAYDYHEKAEQTSSVVRKHVYSKAPDLWALHEDCVTQNIKMLGGHVRAEKFIPLCGVNNTVTFLRDPAQRLASEYQHFLRHGNFSGSFREFYCLPRMQNRLSKILAKVPLEAIGFVGLTEHYNDCLRMLDHSLCVQFPRREDNLGTGAVGLAHSISEEDAQAIEELNDKDMRLFRQARQLHKQRLEVFEGGHAWVHGLVAEASPQKVAGWAWYDVGDNPVELVLKVNGELIENTRAVSFWAPLARLMTPRGGFVGFEFSGPFTANDTVECVVDKTGQVLGGKRKIQQAGS